MLFFKKSENPLVASDLLSNGHVTGYGHHFEKNISTCHKHRSLLISIKSHATNLKVFKAGEFIRDVKFDIL